MALKVQNGTPPALYSHGQSGQRPPAAVTAMPTPKVPTPAVHCSVVAGPGIVPLPYMTWPAMFWAEPSIVYVPAWPWPVPSAVTLAQVKAPDPTAGQTRVPIPTTALLGG